MNWLNLLNIDINSLVNQYIDIIFEGIAQKQNCQKSDLQFYMKYDGRNPNGASKYITIHRKGDLTPTVMYLSDETVRKLVEDAIKRRKK